MFKHVKMQTSDDFFLPLSSRREKGVYFYRINGFSEQIEQLIEKYYEAARQSGVVIEGKIPNPDEKNLSYYEEIMGMDFQLSMGFLTHSLKKWLPRMNEMQRNNMAASIYDTLAALQKAGKNEAMLRNAYIKFMCWLYYKFERIVNRLGQDILPKILYDGEISRYELLLLSVLSNAGCDVLLLQYHGDANYLKLDAASAVSDAYPMEGLAAFPEGFDLKWLRGKMQEKQAADRLYGERLQIEKCTNTWTETLTLDSIRIAAQSRGTQPNQYYNIFLRINGVEDKLTYLNELYQLGLELKNSGRRLLVLEQSIPVPTTEEIQAVNRKNYTSANQMQMLQDLSVKIRFDAQKELQKAMRCAFLDVMLEAAKTENISLNKLTNRAVYLLCWLERYKKPLFANWKMPEIACFIYLGGCKNETEALFLRLLAKLPVDVLILVPDRNIKCLLSDSSLCEIHYEESLSVSRFPTENGDARIGTAAYHAERELDTIMYQDSGMYRNQQYHLANAVTLQTMYEEIGILWNQELKYRPNFSTIGETVTIPVLFAKVSGVKDGAVAAYWSGIKTLLTKDTFLIQNVPFLNPTDENPMKGYAAEFFKNEKLQKNRIKNAKGYPYGVLREETQEYILDKLQLLIDNRTIKGTFENGTEYTIVATVLNLKKELVRLIQKFDFTKTNPKLVYINTTETPISLEDSILTAFLNLVGFDIVFFVPTGYQSIEKYFNRRLMEEHQMGDYIYDLRVPDFRLVSAGSGTRRSWRDKIFKRGT